MADDSGSSAILGVIVGALILGAVLLFVFGGFDFGGGSGGDGPDINVEVPAAPAPGGGS